MESTIGDNSGPVPLFMSILKEELLYSDWFTFIICLAVTSLLLVCSALFSASENALFSLGPNVLKELKEKEDRTSKTLLYLLYNHKRLLATILLANNFVNVGVVFVSTVIFSNSIFTFEDSPVLGFIVQAFAVTTIIVLFGEVFPKVYATTRNLMIARAMALPLLYLSRILYPLVFLLENSTGLLEKRISKKGHQMSIDDLNRAIDMTSDARQSENEKDILKGIVNFGNIPVKQIMRSRMDVSALESDLSFAEVMAKIREWGYSRVPVYGENFDDVKGILYIKDLVPHARKTDFNWLSVIRPPYFVPETKKLDDLMNEFKAKRVHMAIVVDEYGGTSGLVTMEDVLEEIFGEIKDEFDEDDFIYSRLDDNTYVFEGRSLIHDICRITDLEPVIFEDIKGDADTLGGMLIEIEGKIPTIGSKIKFRDFEFIIESADRRKIKRVKMILPETVKKEEL